jgi:hypothetical protein
MSIDALLEITATFFYKGDKAKAEELEEFVCWSQGKSDHWQEVTEPAIPEEPVVELGKFAMMPEGYDCIFSEDAIAFQYNYITEGRGDYPFTCGVGFLTSEIGNDWFVDGRDYYTEMAGKIRSEIESKIERSGQILKVTPDLPIRCIRWIEVVGYHSSRDEWTGEYDSNVEFYGRVKLADISRLINSEV